jgi:hypothetical protein
MCGQLRPAKNYAYVLLLGADGVFDRKAAFAILANRLPARQYQRHGEERAIVRRKYPS